jgi:acyl-CoA synthetase (NDP forming)
MSVGSSGGSAAGLRPEGMQALFRPSSIAVIGASEDPGRIGGRPLRYLAEAGFTGAVYPVNPRYATVQGLPAYPDIGAVEAPVDLAIVALASPLVVGAVRECAAAGVPAVVVFSAGFSEVGEQGAELQRQLAQVAAETGVRVLGPNCLGVMNFHAGVLATFSTSIESGVMTPGTVGFVSQSGAFGAHCLAAGRERGIGFSSWVATGNEVDVDFADCMAYLAQDPATEVIVAYIEGCRDGSKLHEALALAQQHGKPVIMIKVGRSEVGARAAVSHTAALVGADAAYDAVLTRYGVHRVSTIAEMLDVAHACAAGVYPGGERVGVLTVSGGIGILLADAASEYGLDVAPMPDHAQRALRELLPYAGVANPVDATAQILNQPALGGQFLDSMLEDGGYDAVVIFLGHVGLATELMERVRGPLVQARSRHPDRPVVISAIVNDKTRATLEGDGFLVVEDPSAAMATVSGLARLGRSLRAGRRTPARPATPVPPLPAGLLGEHAVKQLLAAVGVPVLAEWVVTDEEEAVRVAMEVGGPVAMKVASPRITHKTEIGGVLLGVTGADAVATSYRTLVERAGQTCVGADREGVLLSPMVSGGVELIVGVQRDDVLGPLVMLGMGGVAAEVLQDVTLRVPPFDEDEARAMAAELRSWPLLTGWRGAPVLDVEALCRALVALSHAAVAWQEEVESLDINPLVVLPVGQGVVALDALLVRRETPSPREHRS